MPPVNTKNPTTILLPATYAPKAEPLLVPSVGEEGTDDLTNVNISKQRGQKVRLSVQLWFTVEGFNKPTQVLGLQLLPCPPQ